MQLALAIVVALLATPSTALALPRAAIRLERASRELAATFIYEGLIRDIDPLELFDSEPHKAFWFDRSPAATSAMLEDAAIDREESFPTRVPLAGDATPDSPQHSPLLKARAKRERSTHRVLPAIRTLGVLPDGAEPEGPATRAADNRAGASRALVRQKLERLAPRRGELERAVHEMLDPLAAPKLPAFDVAVLLLFLSELSSGSLPLAVACSEAVALSIAYGSDEAETHRHVNGLLGSYARERM